ncbi:MAG: hypothetical protein MK171_04035 [Pirellulales bacterium]|nr:hypothetical protein [Pirellulales bacterium]
MTSTTSGQRLAQNLNTLLYLGGHADRFLARYRWFPSRLRHGVFYLDDKYRVCTCAGILLYSDVM